jgi:hypothetical protein
LGYLKFRFGGVGWFFSFLSLVVQWRVSFWLLYPGTVCASVLSLKWYDGCKFSDAELKYVEDKIYDLIVLTFEQ